MSELTKQEPIAAGEAGENRGGTAGRGQPAGRSRPGWLVLVIGACFPLFVVLLELLTRMCGMAFFDPMPNVSHVLLVGFVPLANAWTWLALRGHVRFHVTTQRLINGYAMGVSFVYTLWFLPMLPFAFFGIIVWGLGLLPMAPVFAFAAAVRGFFYLRKYDEQTPLWRVSGSLWGLVIAMAAVTLVQGPVLVTRFAMNLAGSDEPEQRGRAIQVLRLLGSQDDMLRSCYLPFNLTLDPLSRLVSGTAAIDSDKAREIFFRVTGRPFNAVPLPACLRGWGTPGIFRMGNMDFDQGQQTIGSRLAGLSLDSSRIDGSVDSDAGLAYTEWTLEFKNHGEVACEARALIALPPGGVISRVTLWVDGEEREAAFAGRAKVREAYQKVVRRQRDPLLVTTKGTDRAMVQCFPVPPQGGLMKIRIGMTSPLVLKDKDRGLLRLPRFLDCNFRVSEDKRHLVWIESKKPVFSDSDRLVREQPSADRYTLRGELPDRELGHEDSILRADRSPHITTAWCEDKVQGQSSVVIQTLAEQTPIAPEKVVLVVDGSRWMKDYIPQIVEAVAAMPPSIELAGIVISDDEPSRYREVGSDSVHADREALARELARFRFAGGRDNVPALIRVVDLAGDRIPCAIVWIHGPQPVLMESVESLRQRWERRPGNIRIYSVEVGSAADSVMEKLDGITALRTVPRMGTLKQDLEVLFGSWRPDAKVLVFSREMAERQPEKPGSAVTKTSNHLARLWGYDEVLRIYGGKDPDARDKALIVATRYQLVTPVTGAVVLENAAQFKEAGLEPADPSRVPVIPEPETWALLTVAMLIVLWVVWRRRNPCKA